MSGSVRHSTTPLTAVTVHERFSLMRQNTGFPHVILHVVAYPRSALPSRGDLEARVDELQAALPMLSARLIDTATTRPGYVPGSEWPASLIMHEATFTPTEGEDEALKVYRDAMDAFSALDSSMNPMWRVTLFTASTGERAYLTFAANHLIVDGRGSTLLLRALTEHLGSPSTVAREDWSTPTRFDDTVSTSPSLPFLVPIVFRELLLPKFPRFMQRPFLSSDPWPSAVPGNPLTRGWDILLLSIPAAQVQPLKDAGRAHGVATLHPLIKMAYLAALWAVCSTPAMPLHVAASTARDERDPSLGHASITHNYVSSTEFDATLAPGDSFWARAQELALKVGPAGVAEGRMTMGLLRHIPDPEVDPSAPDFDPAKPTGWEKYFTERAGSGTPYRDSVSVSNLGPVRLPPGAVDAWWGQSATPFGSALMVNVIGHEGGVRVSSAFRFVATDKERTRALHDSMRRVLERIAADESNDMTLADITA